MSPEILPTHAGRGGERAWVVALLATFAALCGLKIAMMLRATGGTFVYSLDDAYIHLSVAENIARGHYGVNATEFSAPSSSILWPFLLAPFTPFAFATYVPLVSALVTSAGCVVFFHRIASDALGRPTDLARQALAAICALLLIPLTNLIGLTVNGMEHSLQLLLTASAISGLMREGEDGKLPRWLVPVLVLGPLIRYENLAVSIPGLAIVWLRGHRRGAVQGAAALAVVGLLFTLRLVVNGAGVLPVSVQAKLGLASGEGFGPALERMFTNLRSRQGAILGIGALAAAMVAVDARLPTTQRLVAGLGATVGALHLAAGRFGWLGRYEIYAVAAVTLVLLAHFLRRIDAGGWKTTLTRSAVLGCGTILVGQPNFTVPIRSIVGARENYEIHFQVRDFVVNRYQGSIAVCDLGIMSYRNPSYVLDFGGLANREVQEARRVSERTGTAAYMADLADRYGVRLAIIFPEWFPSLPEHWRKVAELRLNGGRFARPEKTLGFYATDAETEARVLPMLRDFATTLKGRNQLVVSATPGDSLPASR